MRQIAIKRMVLLFIVMLVVGNSFAFGKEFQKPVKVGVLKLKNDLNISLESFGATILRPGSIEVITLEDDTYAQKDSLTREEILRWKDTGLDFIVAVASTKLDEKGSAKITGFLWELKNASLTVGKMYEGHVNSVVVMLDSFSKSVNSYFKPETSNLTEKQKTDLHKISESLILKKPLGELRELGSRLRFKFMVTQVDEGKIRVHVLSDSRAYEYLKTNDSKIDLKEVYRDGKNIYEMPQIMIYASDKSPLDLEAVSRYLGNDLTLEISKFIKIESGNLIEPIEFYSITFNGFEVSGWLPVVFLPKLLGK
jgi:thiamine pyrophosphokinase